MIDQNVNPESVASFPGVVQPLYSWLAYENVLRVELDPGMVLHKPLPQTNPAVDSLSSLSGRGGASDPYDYYQDVMGSVGINMRSLSQQADIIQRMATSTYRVRLRGYGVRAGYRVPVPAILRIGSAVPVPDVGTWAEEGVLANYSGVPIYFSRWELWYLVPVPPSVTSLPPPPNLAAHIRGDAVLPKTILAPLSVPEVGAPLPPLANLIQGGQK